MLSNVGGCPVLSSTIYDMLDAEIVDFCDKLFRKQGFVLG